MTDVSAYSAQCVRVKELWVSLREARKRLQEMELQLVGEWHKTNGQPLVVVSDAVPATIKIHEQSRRLPLTQKDLSTKLVECLSERFGKQVPTAGIAEFAQTVTKRIWSERRTRTEKKVRMKFNANGV